MLQRRAQKGLGSLGGQGRRERARAAHLGPNATHLRPDKQDTCPSLSFLT